MSCNSLGSTHHNACDCREEHFRTLESQLSLAVEALEGCRRLMYGLSLDARQAMISQKVVEKVKSALSQIKSQGAKE